MDHSGTIVTDQVWALADSPHYITGNVIVPTGVHLTIEAGSEIRYCPISAPGESNAIFVMGRLTAVGTRDLPIEMRLNTANDGIHGYFNKPVTITTPMYAYSIVIYSTNPTSLIFCNFSGMFTLAAIITTNIDVRDTLTIRYCTAHDVYIPIIVAARSKARIVQSKIGGSYAFSPQNYAPYLESTGAQVYSEWCEFEGNSRIASAFPGTLLDLTYCLLRDVTHSLYTSIAGARLIYRTCFIKTSPLHYIPFVLGFTTSLGTTYTGNTEIYDSLILVDGMTYTIPVGTPPPAAIEVSHVASNIISQRNHWEGIRGTNRLCFQDTSGEKNNIVSDSDYIANFAYGIVSNIDTTNAPTGGDSTNSPPMFKNSTRINAVSAAFFKNEIDNVTLIGVTQTTAEIRWDTGTPSKTLLRLSTTPDNESGNILRPRQDWTGIDGVKYSMNENISGWEGHRIVITGLKPGQTYYYRAIGENIAGELFIDPTVRNFTTQDAPPILVYTEGSAIDADISDLDEFTVNLSDIEVLEVKTEE